VNGYVDVCKKWMDSAILSVVICTCNRTERGFAVVLDPHISYDTRDPVRPYSNAVLESLCARSGYCECMVFIKLYTVWAYILCVPLSAIALGEYGMSREVK